jgi:hypothetical protein
MGYANGGSVHDSALRPAETAISAGQGRYSRHVIPARPASDKLKLAVVTVAVPLRSPVNHTR